MTLSNRRNEAPRANARGIFKFFGERNPPKHYPTPLKLRGVSAISHSFPIKSGSSAKADKFLFLTSFLFGVFSFLMIVLLWLLLTDVMKIDEIALPKLGKVIQEIYSLAIYKGIFTDIIISLARVITGFGLGAIIGIPLGILCGRQKSIQALLETNFNLLRFVPTAAMIPLLILWFGVGEAGKVVLIMLRVLPYLVLYISNAAASVEKEYFEAAKMLGANQKQILTRVVFPRIFPQIWDICRIEFGSSWSTVILVEILGANSGIGYRLVLAQRYVHITEIFSLIIVMAIVALAFDSLFRFVYKRLFPWAEKSKTVDA